MAAIIHAMRGAGGVLSVAGCALVAALGAGASATAAPSYGPPAGWADLAPLVLTSTDFPGSRVSSEGYVKPDTDSLAEYDRTILGARIAGKRTFLVENDLDVFKRINDADLLIAALPLGLQLEATRIGREFGRETGLKIMYTKVGKAQGLGVGNNSVAIVLHLGTKTGEIRIVFAVARVGSIDSLIVFAGLPKAQLGVTHAKLLARTSVGRIRTGMLPQGTAAPTITGTVAVGQTVTASTGTWLNFPVTYTYQWQRCDAAGANCAPIPGATAQTYVLTASEAGSTLEVVVGATNLYGTSMATSPPTVVVPPESAPPGS